jgi:PAS domain S-box-containing protein
MHRHKILHVDDNELDLQLVYLSFKQRAPELELVQTNNVDDGLKLCSEFNPDCVLSDYQMPDRNGVDLLKELRSNGEHIPFVFLTGQGNEQLAVEALRSGADDYFSKEESFAHYERLINSLKRLCQMHQERKAHQDDLEKLKQSEERFRLAAKASTDFIFEWIPETNALNWYGDIYTALGHPPEDLQNARDYVRFIHPDDLHFATNVMESRAEDNSPFSIEYRIRRADGDYLFFQVRGLAIEDKQGNPLKWIGACKDITVRRNYEDTLRFQAELLDNIHDAVTATDLKGNITYINESSARSLKKTKEDLIGKHVKSFGENPESGATQQELIEKTQANGEWQGFVSNFSEDGEEIIMNCRTRVVRDKEGNIAGMVGIASDVTRMMTNSLTLSSLKEAIEGIDALVLLCMSDGTLQTISPPLLSALKIDSLEEIKGIHCQQLPQNNAFAEKLLNQVENYCCQNEQEKPEKTIYSIQAELESGKQETITIKAVKLFNELEKSVCTIFLISRD